MSSMVELTIDGEKITVPEGTTILNAAQKVGINVPTLCYHPDLKGVKGNCRICVVEVKGRNKLECACVTPVSNGMEIYTNTKKAVKARKLNIELMLADHPTDCLQCIKNNNCELQSLSAQLGVRGLRFDNLKKTDFQDNTSISLNYDASKCIDCGRCVYVCNEIQAVGALASYNRGYKVHAGASPNFFFSPCIKCGQCTSYCPTGAIYEEECISAVWDALHDPDTIVVSQMAPAVRAGIGEEFGLPPGSSLTKKIYSGLRMLGVDHIFDTNFAADLTIIEEATEFVKRFTTKPESLPLFTSCCPAWVDYLEKFVPESIDNFSTAKSPHQMLGAVIKTFWADKTKTDKKKIFQLSIMPCTAKKYEILRCYDMFSSGEQDVDVVLTTRELARLFKQAGIDLLNLTETEADPSLGMYTGAATIFGTTGGVMEAAVRTAYHYVTKEELAKVDFKALRGAKGVKEATVDIKGIKVKVAVAHGIGNVKYVLDKVNEAKAKGEELPWHFVEVMACPHGCVGGGGQPYGGLDKRAKRAEALYEEDRNLPLRKSHQNPYIIKLYEEFLGEPGGHKAHELLHTKYYKRPLYGGDNFACPNKDKLKVPKSNNWTCSE